MGMGILRYCVLSPPLVPSEVDGCSLLMTSLPCRKAKSTRRVKAKASVPPPLRHPTCTALTPSGLEYVSCTGSRGRGAGCGRRWAGTLGERSRSAKGRFGDRLGDSVGQEKRMGTPEVADPCAVDTLARKIIEE